MGVLTLQQLICEDLTLPPAPPQVNIPFLGQLQAARKSLYAMPDPSEYLLRLLNSMNLALVPLRQFIEIVETIFLFKDCMVALPNAIMTLSPKPIFDCLKKLLKKLVTFITFIPPLSYIRTFVDVLAVVLMMTDEIVYMLAWIDMQITRYVSLVNEALSTGDTALMRLAQCQASEMKLVAMNAVDVMRIVGPMIRLLLEPIISSISNPILQAKLTEITDIGAQIENLGDTVKNLQLDAIAPLLAVLSTLTTIIWTLQNILVAIYNVVGGIMGKESLPQRDRPTAVNF